VSAPSRPRRATRPRRAVPERDPGGVGWADKNKNRRASSVILAKYSKVDPALIRRTTRVHFATRLRLSMAQPWIDAFAEFGVIPQSFSALDLVK